MKRKILLLTGLAISLFLLFIAAGAGIFTGSSEQVKETGNSLSAEINEGKDVETSFDYPFIKLIDLSESGDSNLKEKYTPHIDFTTVVEIEWPDDPMYYEPAEGMLSYQEAANISGKIIKYLFGYTAHSSNKAMINYISERQPPTFEYNYQDENVKFIINIDALTGKVLLLTNSLGVNIQPTDQPEKIVHKSASKEMADKVTDAAIYDLEILGYKVEKDKFNNIDYRGMIEGTDKYSCFVDLDSGEKLYMLYRTTDNTLFELQFFSVSV